MLVHLKTKVAHWGVTKVRGWCMTAVMKPYPINCQKMMFKWSFLPFSILLWRLNTSNLIYMDVKCRLQLSCHCIWNQALNGTALIDSGVRKWWIQWFWLGITGLNFKIGSVYPRKKLSGKFLEVTCLQRSGIPKAIKRSYFKMSQVQSQYIEVFIC